MRLGIGAVLVAVGAIVLVVVMNTGSGDTSTDRRGEGAAGVADGGATGGGAAPSGVNSGAKRSIEKGAAEREPSARPEAEPRAALAGHVIDAKTGMPIGGARVEARSAAADAGEPAAITTDANGRFEFRDLEGEFHVAAAHDAYRPAEAVVTARESAEIELRLAPLAFVIGFVRKGDASPAVDAIVTLVAGETSNADIARAAGASAREGRSRQVDADGAYRLACDAGPYRVVASLRGGEPRVASPAFEVASGESVEVDLTFSTGIVVYGIAYDPGLIPREGATISAVSREEGVNRGTKTDTRGYYEIDGLVPGRYLMTAVNLPDTGRDPNPVTKTIQIPSDVERMEVNLGDETPGSVNLTGVVLRGGEPVPDLIVQMRYAIPVEDGMEGWKITRTREDGRFSLPYVYPGRVAFLVVEVPKGKPSGPPEYFLEEIPNRAEYHVELRYPENAVVGRIVLGGGNGGSAPREGKVSLRVTESFGDGEIASMLAKRNYASALGEDGSFRIENVSPGRYALVGTATPVGARPPALVLVKGIQVREIVTDLGEIDVGGEGARVSIAVRDASGKPVEGAMVDGASDDVPLVGLAAMTDKAGIARMGATLPPGDYAFAVTCSGYAPARLDEVEVEKEDERQIDITLHRGGSILVTVMDDSGAPVEGVRVRLADSAGRALVDPAGGMMTVVYFGGEKTDAAGQYHFKRLEPGLYLVIVTLPGDRGETSVGADVVDERTSEIHVTLQ